MEYRRVIFAAMLTAALLFCVAGSIAEAGMQGACRVVIPIENVTDKDRQDESFSFSIEKCSDECPDPEKKEVRIRGSGKAAFVVNAGQPGRFDYTVRGSDAGGGYHVIIASVRNEKNEISASLIITDEEGGKPEKIVFANTSGKKKKHDNSETKTGDTFDERMFGALVISMLALLLISITGNRKARKSQA